MQEPNQSPPATVPQQPEAKPPVRKGTLLLNHVPVGQLPYSSVPGLDDVPYIGLSVFFRKDQVVTAKIGFTDDRAERMLRDQSGQLPKGKRGLIMISGPSSESELSVWRPLILRRFQPGIHTRTYATNGIASRTLLEKIFEQSRLMKAAHIEVPALARKIATIAEHDPEFAVAIYGKVFGHHVGSQQLTSFSGGQILSMNTSVADMYSTASYALAGHFPAFLEDNLPAATEAVIQVVEGHIATRHPIAGTIQERNLQVGGATARVIEDGSRYWAWEIETGHPDSFQMIVQRFLATLRECDAGQAVEIVSVVIAKNRSAILWARLLMVAAERPDIYGPLLWELATHEEILLCPDTAKDAIDAIAAFYPTRAEQDRRTFEEKVFKYGEGDAGAPGKS